MKLTDEQKKEKLARDNIRRLINRVSSEYSFKKWRNLRGYLHSIGSDKSVIESTHDKELTRVELDELLRQYEEAAYKNILPANHKVIESISKEIQDNKEASKETGQNVLRNISEDKSLAIEDAKATEKNNYGLSKSEKETVSLFWFQKKAAAELLKGFTA